MFFFAIKICEALCITPDVIMTETNPNLSVKQTELMTELEKCSVQQKETALELLAVYLRSVK